MNNTDIDQILANFNFFRVYKVMAALGWTYFDSPETPTTPRLNAVAHACLEEALGQYNSGQTEGYCATGGFEALCSKQGLRLLFVIEEQDTWSHRAGVPEPKKEIKTFYRMVYQDKGIIQTTQQLFVSKEQGLQQLNQWRLQWDQSRKDWLKGGAFVSKDIGEFRLVFLGFIEEMVIE